MAPSLTLDLRRQRKFEKAMAPHRRAYHHLNRKVPHLQQFQNAFRDENKAYGIFLNLLKEDEDAGEDVARMLPALHMLSYNIIKLAIIVDTSSGAISRGGILLIEAEKSVKQGHGSR